MNTIMSHAGDIKGSNQSKSQVSISRDGSSFGQSSMSPKEQSLKFTKPENHNQLDEVNRSTAADLALMNSYTDRTPLTTDQTLFSSSLFSQLNDSPKIDSIGS